MITLNAILRYQNGTSYSRHIRKFHNQLPGIIYGNSLIKSPILITMLHDKIFHLQKKNEFYSENILLVIDRQKYIVRVKEIQRHAFKLRILHIDFIYISLS
ncbi:50S ribosomal protein L25 [Buchnera aphidicola]|uniref:50S ribosomal protein L25 n=1 Tax=Buchnera aphidicola TaxID=9 RepID=UPI00094DB087|nr:50S ribosomal protein L25 [Buchnera aphidicola]